MRRVDELQQLIVSGALNCAPDFDWDLVRVRHAKLGGVGSFSSVTATGDIEVRFRPDDTAVLAADDLHDEMYTPATGAWFSFECTVQRSGEYHFAFNYDEPVTFGGREPQEESWLVDLRQYPRPWALIPDWHLVKQRYTEHEWAQVIEADQAAAVQQS